MLALGMLTCIAKGFEMMRQHGLGDHRLDTDIESSDPAVYEMLLQGDSIGVFQVESRAQINMLPRLQSERILRSRDPGGDRPARADRRRHGASLSAPALWRGEDRVSIARAPQYPQDELRGVLEQDLRRSAVPGAGDAARHHRCGLHATRRPTGCAAPWRPSAIWGPSTNSATRWSAGMVRRGYKQDFAERCFKQIEGFGSYGFPESHAQSFARLVYVSAWIKHHHPEVLCCALLNSQPMGFYAPAQLVRDAVEHGVEVAVDRCECEQLGQWAGRRAVVRIDDLALRLGFRQIGGFSEDWGEAIMARARHRRPLHQHRASGPPRRLAARALHLLADADACARWGRTGEQALWEVRRTPTDELPLFAAARARELGEEPAIDLKAMTLGEHVAADYQTHRLVAEGASDAAACVLTSMPRASRPASASRPAKNGAQVRVGGVVLVRQRPGKGNAIFITLEDEDAICNILLWARRFEAIACQVMGARLMIVDGELQRSREGVIHIMASRVIDRSRPGSGASPRCMNPRPR